MTREQYPGTVNSQNIEISHVPWGIITKNNTYLLIKLTTKSNKAYLAGQSMYDNHLESTRMQNLIPMSTFYCYYYAVGDFTGLALN